MASLTQMPVSLVWRDAGCSDHWSMWEQQQQHHGAVPMGVEGRKGHSQLPRAKMQILGKVTSELVQIPLSG